MVSETDSSKAIFRLLWGISNAPCPQSATMLDIILYTATGHTECLDAKHCNRAPTRCRISD